jgi:arabinose-5-phosphate isomerase
VSRAGRLDVVGIGSMVVDRVHRAPRLIGADAKVLLRGVDGAAPVREFVGGVVLNHLGWAAALGLRAGIFGRQGDDAGGRFLRAAMDRLGIERDLALVAEATSLAEIFVDDAGERAIYMAPGATAGTTALHVRRDFGATIRRSARLTTEVSQLPLAAAREAVAVAREAGIPTVVDLDVPPADALATLGDEADFEALLRAADLLKPARAAARELAPAAAGDALAAARALRERFGCGAVVVTDGEAGCAIAARDFEGCVPTRPVKAVDSTGAGDAFLGGLLVALHHGLGWEAAARLGNACGAACVERLGAFPDDAAAARARVLELFDGPALPLAPLPAAAADLVPEAAAAAADPGPEAVAAAADPGPEAAAAAAEALAAFGVAVEEMAALERRLDPRAFERAVALVRTARERGGRLHVTGIGKPEHVARYAASLLSSTGTPAAFLHGTEAVHGSAGQVLDGDVVIAISNSGETRETLEAVAAVRRLGARVVAVTGGRDSSLARTADVLLDAGVAREGGPLGLAPRASAAAELLVVASLAAALERATGFTRADYALRHPNGTLGELTRR